METNGRAGGGWVGALNHHHCFVVVGIYIHGDDHPHNQLHTKRLQRNVYKVVGGGRVHFMIYHDIMIIIIATLIKITIFWNDLQI